MRLNSKIIFTTLPLILLQAIVLLIPTLLIIEDFVGKEVKGSINDSTMQVQSALDSEIAAIEANSDIFSQSIILNRYLQTESETLRANVMHRVLLKEFSIYMTAHPEYIEISLLMPDGYEEVSLLSNKALNVTDEEQETIYFKNIATSPSNFEISTFIDPNTNEWTLVAARKIYQKNTVEQTESTKDVLKGYLIIKSQFDFISQYLNNNSLLEHGFAVVHDAMGTQVLLNSQEELIFNDQLKVNTNRDYIETFTWLINGESYIVGQKKLIQSLYFTIGWPESQLSPLFKRVSYISIINSSIVAIFSALILFWLLNKLLVKPIRQLSLSAQSMGKGDKQWSFKPQANDEISELATTIQGMGLGLIKQKQKVHEIAYIDSLTKLPNRRQFMDALNLQYSSTKTKLPDIALLFIDLDGFKEVNDNFGHDTGDLMLIAVASRLKNVLRTGDRTGSKAAHYDSDHIARLGGDEFTLLIKNIKDHHIAEIVSKRILHAFTRPFIIKDREFLVGASIGIAVAKECGESAVDLLKNADTAMYEAKVMGKNTFCFFSKTAAQKSFKAIEMKEALRRAIDNNELKLAYQPQICSKTGEMIGCEALLRWKQAGKGWIPPDVFIPIAEESGLILPIGRWVLLEASHQIKLWQKMGYKVVPVWVNVSNIQLDREDMHQVIMSCLAETGVSSELLSIEVTESSIMQGAGSIAQLEKIQSEGIKIALDDFGTGYSSLSALRGLPIDELKIDKSFVSDLSHGEDGQAIVSAIIAMAHQLHLAVVAEGVETVEELTFLKQNNADIIQGYYFSKPLLSDDFLTMMKKLEVA